MSIYLISPGTSSSLVSGGGTPLFRGVASLLAGLDSVRSVEQAVVAAEWSAPDVQVIAWNNPDECVELASSLDSDDVVLKVSGALPGRWDRECDYALALYSGAKTWYLDADAPSRLQLLNYGPSYLEDVLPRFRGVVLCGGGTRAAHIYRAMGARRVSVLTIALAWFGTPARPESVEPRQRFDLAAVFGGGATRSSRVSSIVDVAARLGYKVGFAGPKNIDLPDSVSQLGFLDGEGLADLVVGSRFSLSLLRADVVGFPDAHACRMVEAAKWRSVVLSDPFDGIDRLLVPNRELFVISDIGDVELALATDEARRREMSSLAYEHARAVAHQDGRQLRELVLSH